MSQGILFEYADTASISVIPNRVDNKFKVLLSNGTGSLFVESSTVLTLNLNDSGVNGLNIDRDWETMNQFHLIIKL